MRPGFLMGVAVGVVGVWAWHHFASPLPGAKRG
jgi:hypothetical protein